MTKISAKDANSELPAQRGEQTEPGHAEPAGNSGSSATHAYAVGYGRPPVHTRFKPGQSGNPKGRPKGRSNYSTIVERVFNRSVSIQRGDRISNVTQFEALVQTHTEQGIAGDHRSGGMVLNLAI